MTELTGVLKKKEATEKCHTCFKEFNDPENRKVRDHSNYTGLYRGTVHNNCNLKYRMPDRIPIAFHNVSGYGVYFLSGSWEKSLTRMIFGSLLKIGRSILALMSS